MNVYSRDRKVRTPAGDYQDTQEKVRQVRGFCGCYCLYRYNIFVLELEIVPDIYMSGIAACNIGGVTIHSFAGIGLGIDKEEVLATRIRRNKKAMSRWLRTRVLIIDESRRHLEYSLRPLPYTEYDVVSMVDGELFDKLARLGSMLRKNPAPFGGIQVYALPHEPSPMIEPRITPRLLSLETSSNCLQYQGSSRRSNSHSKPSSGQLC